MQRWRTERVYEDLKGELGLDPQGRCLGRALRAVAVVGAHDLDAELELAGDLDPAGAVGSLVAVATALIRPCADAQRAR
jgi:hypothetical protein